MNVLLWILQVLLALHTAMGAVWKFFNSQQAVPSLSAIPHAVWLGLSVVELVCCVALVLPAFLQSLAKLPALAAAFIVAEMLLFVAVHFASGAAVNGQVVYWVAVAAFSAFIAFGRWRANESTNS
jgi:hypothetical protein